METGLASCTGLAILLADACRSVGVPARLAGVPNWIDDRGNHTWVEIWDQRWHFAGAAEPDANGLDHAWFQHDASLAVKDSKEHASGFCGQAALPQATHFDLDGRRESDDPIAAFISCGRFRDDLISTY